MNYFIKIKFLTKILFRLTILTIFCCNIFSCSLNKKADTKAISNTLKFPPKFPIYGNYCGPLYPPKGSTPLPIDSVDNACRNHDLCYDHYGYLNSDCDNTMLKELNYVTPESASENLARKLLIAYFSNIIKLTQNFQNNP